MRKIFLILAAVYLGIAFGCSAPSILDKINGTWAFDSNATWEFTKPGRSYTATEDVAGLMLKGYFVAIDIKSQTFAIKTNNNADSLQSFRIISEEKNSILLKMNGQVESFEIRQDGILLICPPLGDTQKCLAFKKRSSDPKAIGSLALANEISEPIIEQESNPQNADPVVVKLDPFLVNLVDKSGKRYVRATFEVETISKPASEFLSKERAKTRDAVIVLLSKKTYDDISSTESKLTLKDEVKAAINNKLGQNVIKKVFITEMIIQ